MLDQITPMVLTYDEEPNLRRILTKLNWAKRIIVIDSGSKDQTLEILASHPQVSVFFHPFSDFASQCNFGLPHVTTPWTLSLDADYELSDEIIGEMASLRPTIDVGGYRARFKYCIYGKPLHGSVYPPRIVLYRTGAASYRNEGHSHCVTVSGNILPLRGPIFHDDRKPLSRWFSAQQRYARHEAQHLLNGDKRQLAVVDRLRLWTWPAPLGAAILTLLRGCLLDGWAGWYYVLQRVLAEIMVALELLDAKLRARVASERE